MIYFALYIFMVIVCFCIHKALDPWHDNLVPFLLAIVWPITLPISILFWACVFIASLFNIGGHSENYSPHDEYEYCD